MVGIDGVHTMGNVTSEILANNDVPCRAISSVELLLDLGSNVFFDVVFFECSGGDVDGLLLHLL